MRIEELIIIKEECKKWRNKLVYAINRDRILMYCDANWENRKLLRDRWRSIPENKKREKQTKAIWRSKNTEKLKIAGAIYRKEKEKERQELAEWLKSRTGYVEPIKPIPKTRNYYHKLKKEKLKEKEAEANRLIIQELSTKYKFE